MVAFLTTAALEPDDVDGVTDVYAHDLRNGRTVRVGRTTSDGRPVTGTSSIAPAISGTGRHVALTTSAPLRAGDETRQSVYRVALQSLLPS